MSEAPNQPTSDHADKYNDPRVSITRRGILIALAIGIFGVAGSCLSILGRRTQKVKTTEFWGESSITAFQLGERMILLPRGNETFEPVELSGTPGLGHLRRLLLDERNYDWSSVSTGQALGDCGEPVPKKPRCVQLRFTDPTAHRFDSLEVDIDLQTGWLGPSDGSKRIKLLDRTKPKLAKYFETTITVEQLRSDFRKD